MVRPVLLLFWLGVIAGLDAQEPPRTRNPHGAIDAPCQNCHATSTWRPIRAVPEFSHDTETAYPLRGLHEGVRCTDCHRNLVFSNVGVQCADCHADPHVNQFGARCEQCHSVQGWTQQVEQVRDHQNRFPLIGAHAAVQCAECHTGGATGTFTGLSTECVICHQQDFSSIRQPDHVAVGFPTQCEDCHGVDQWTGARFDHDRFSDFALTGAHANVDCQLCHVGGQFTGTSTDCFACHFDDFNTTASPNHSEEGFPTNCEVCHTTAQWDGASFDHNAATRFPLTGKHSTADCQTCHINGKFAGTPQNCVDCHISEYNSASEPDHGAGFPTTCENCHNTTQWEGAVFDHSSSTAFPLTGKHTNTDCQSCHVDGQFAGTPQNCVDCHVGDYNSASDPSHGGFPTTCESCHNTAQWQGATFDHNTSTMFPLTGKHSSVDCQSCHVDGKFAGTPQACADCHHSDYGGSTNPDHAGAGFPTSCESCHTTAEWANASFDHSTSTEFPLTGKHVSMDCQQCHINGQFAGIPQDCGSCHLEDSNATTDPDHAAAGFPATCETCHNTANWTGAVFDHNTSTKFPLTGKHVTTDCAQCHVNGKFAGTPQNCSGCHLSDFNGTTDPNHSAAGFPTTCENCHNTTQWEGAVFDHNTQTSFLLTGKHTSADCQICHVDGKFAGTPKACAGCHLGEFNSTTDPDHSSAGFPTVCENCHNTSQWEGAVFDHNTSTQFPLTGKHVATDCAQCHVNGKFAGTPQNCVGCHLSEFNSTSDPNHSAAGFPTTCETCHNTSQWQGAVFDHTTSTKFPLTGKHTSTDCKQCHTNGQFAGTPQNCAGCHLSDYSKTNDPDHASAGFPAACENCHNTSQWDGAVFDHNTQTKFPLTGKHSSTDCQQCHVDGKFAGTPQNCAGCHLNEFNNTSGPNHSAAGFPTTCENCHNTTQWEGAAFDHSTQTKFPLTGKHVSTDCQQCHVDGKFAGTPQNCAGCHLPEYNGTTDPDHASAGFPTTCENCHNTAKWEGAVFDHNTQTKFPLTGKHVSTDCQQCHVDGKFAGTPQNCAGCHLPGYNGTTDPDHASAGFPTTCENCHDTTQWEGAVFDHNTLTKFPLTGKHVAADCTQCHVNGQFAGTPQNCAGCHLTDYNGTNNPDHSAAGFPTACENCHNTAKWEGAVFDHNTSTKFPLTGKHVASDCAQCHVNGKFAGTPQNCAGCHIPEYNTTTDPHHASAGFPTTCENCHNTSQWSGAAFDHNTSTQFPLTGKHVATDCKQCHVNGKFAGTPQACIGCHLSDFNSTTDPDHAAAGFPTACETCHDTSDWGNASFDHNTSTKFPLTGKHVAADCTQCHVNGQFAGTPQNCAGCHLPDYNGTTNPQHSPAGFPTACENCHNTAKWEGAVFDHNTSTKFPLTGKHVASDCAQCHLNGKFAGTPQNCAGCHIPEYNTTTDPNHASAGFPTTCENCHNTSQWPGAVFDHNTSTKFPLTGKHIATDCKQCHVNGKFAGTPQACVGCHLSDFDSTTDPDHAAAGFPQACENCHNTSQWPGAVFDHNTSTQFPLTGKHIATDCTQCHVNGKFAGTPQNCAGCHLSDYNGANDPDHSAAGFPTACENCHNTSQWDGAVFDHNTSTKFPLTGKHIATDCKQCHVNGKFTGTPQNCAGCHLSDYNGTNNPDHSAAGFPTVCENCHNTSQWEGAVFDHNTSTQFPLTGKHISTDCTQCHVNGKFAGTPQNCAGCHLSDYNGTNNPDHSAAGFPTACENCHNTSQWPGAVFDHNTSTKFPLTGKHIATGCTQCHVNGKFAGTPQNCTGCHLPDYNGTNNPDHSAAGFPTACENCHNTSQWPGAVFDHNTSTNFALTGKHAAAGCAQCHVNGKFAGTPQNCAGCHLSDYNGTTNPDHSAAGFPTACQTCHNTSQWLGATFDHNTTTNFALTGKHAAADCTQCHVNGKFAGTPQNCAGCHLSDYNGANNPDHSAAGFPTACENCHNTSQWPGAVFNHNTSTTFPLTGKHVAADCQQCHVNGKFAGTPQNCAGCHLSDFNGTTNPDHSAAGVPTACESCHDTSDWANATFDHNTTTTFPLTGKHAAADCTLCHVNGKFAGTPQDCAGCHLPDYNGTNNPDHSAAGFPTACETCHNTSQWLGATFDHNTTTTFPLAGKHAAADCTQCHVNGKFAGTPQNCADCHLSDYNGTNNPDHSAAGFPTACESCHDTSDWANATFDHNTTTTFPLTGKHAAADCTQCHVNGKFAGTPQNCAGCHISDYNSTNNPDHSAAGFPTACETCHNTSMWQGAVFNHNTSTTFPLTGKHVATDCAQCHVNGQFAGTPQNCGGCHISEYNATTTPDHQAAGFSVDCSMCHTTSQWPGAVFDHSQTNFPLTGAHQQQNCQTCHVNGQFKGLGTACATCHRDDYDGTTNPNHQAAGFPLQCETCHSTTKWLGAVFDHSQTNFPLTGAHKNKPGCTDCHVNGKFAGTPTDCYSCHLTEYNNVANPNHKAAGFPTDCAQCHTTTRWDGAQFNHSFPIYSGAHKQEKWQVCSACHTNSANFRSFSCLNCHEHRKSEMDDDHSEVGGYVYNSPNCLSCHPNGKS